MERVRVTQAQLAKRAKVQKRYKSISPMVSAFKCKAMTENEMMGEPSSRLYIVGEDENVKKCLLYLLTINLYPKHTFLMVDENATSKEFRIVELADRKCDEVVVSTNKKKHVIFSKIERTKKNEGNK